MKSISYLELYCAQRNILNRIGHYEFVYYFVLFLDREYNTSEEKLKG